MKRGARIVLSLTVLLVSGALSAQESANQPARKSITHEALWMMKRVGSPVVSPDGKQVVFPVLEPNYDPDKAVSDLRLVPADGHAPPRRLTHTKAPEEGVAWSPDSRSITFSTKPEDSRHFYQEVHDWLGTYLKPTP